MALVTPFAAISLLLAMGLCFRPSAASNVPGDIYPTTGKTINGFTYYANVTTYANASADVMDITVAAKNGNYAEATRIYELGKNSFRNLELVPPTLRIAKSAVARDYGVEDWYVLASEYYRLANGSENSRYLDGPLSDALAGTGDFAPGGAFSSLRSTMIAAYIQFYPVLYYYHEADAAWNSLRINSSNTQPARVEAGDAAGCYLAPSVYPNPGNRVAPGYNPWDVSNAVGAYFCTLTRDPAEGPGVRSSEVNVEFRRVAIQMRDLFEGAPASVDPAVFGGLRLQHQRLLNINQMQLVLRAVHQAMVARPCKRGGSCEIIEHAATAYASWLPVEPALSFYRVPARDLKDVRAMLLPRRWKGIADSKARTKAYARKVVKAIKDLATRAGYNWKREIAGCKL